MNKQEMSKNLWDIRARLYQIWVKGGESSNEIYYAMRDVEHEASLIDEAIRKEYEMNLLK